MANQDIKAVLQVVVWHVRMPLQSEQSLNIIRQWWVGLAGKQTTWNVSTDTFDNPLTYQCILEDTALDRQMLRWRRQECDSSCHIPIKQLALDLKQQELAILTDSTSQVTYKVRPV